MEFKWLIGVVFALSVTAAHAEPTCTISPQKRQAIEQILCGQGAVEPEYKFYGPGCVERSSKIRMQDSAGQVARYRLCGDEAFAQRLLGANLKAAQFLQSLVPCTSEKVDMIKLFNNALDAFGDISTGRQCDNTLRSKLDRRRPFFEQQIRQTEQGNAITDAYDSLRIAVDANGNISDR